VSSFRAFGDSDAGRKRRRNEDDYVCDEERGLFAVADGMGGAQAGEVASHLAAAAVAEGAIEGRSGQQTVVDLIQEANRRVYRRAHEDAAASGMGTTITVALASEGAVTFGHVGDSRAYLVREGSLEQLTDDHSLVAELTRQGKLSPEEAAIHPQRSVITRALGTDPDVDVDTFVVRPQPGDLFLVCSDGLSSMVDDDTILEIVERERGSLQAVVQALIDAANRNGGEDNITAVCFEIVDQLGATQVRPAVSEPATEDEDTLSGLEPVPAVDTMVLAPGELDQWLAGEDGDERTESLVVAEPPPPRSRRLLWLGLGLLLLGIVVALVVWGLARAHFVGADRSGHVVVYQGVPWDVTGGFRLYRKVYVSPLLVKQLSVDERRRLFDHDLHSRAGALAALRPYELGAMP
jgi:protein phosphatase